MRLWIWLRLWTTSASANGDLENHRFGLGLQPAINSLDFLQIGSRFFGDFRMVAEHLFLQLLHILLDHMVIQGRPGKAQERLGLPHRSTADLDGDGFEVTLPREGLADPVQGFAVDLIGVARGTFMSVDQRQEFVDVRKHFRIFHGSQDKRHAGQRPFRDHCLVLLVLGGVAYKPSLKPGWVS